MTAIERLPAVGIRRLGSKERGFRYRRAEGGRPSPKDLKRIEGLRIPPAWREVAIHPSARGSVQAVGKDAAGRWQYRYHPASTARREGRKYGRLLKFAEALPRMRRTVSRDLARPGLPREKVLASVLRILSTCFLRPGSQAYAQDNGSFGLATLRRQHVAVEGDQIRFNFPGKAGKRQTCEMRDRRVAWVVRRLVQEPGEVFKYRNGNGLFVDVRRRDINAYIKELMGETFSAKDFRTWAGTLLCACALARAGVEASETRTARRRKLVAAIKETAALLGNTPAVCRSSYIYPSVLHGFERGRVIDRHFHTVEEMLERRASALHASERALLRFLKKKAP